MQANQNLEVLLAEPATAGSAPSQADGRHVLVCLRGEEIDLELMRQGLVLASLTGARLTMLFAFRPGVDGERRAVLVRDRAQAREMGAQLVELPSFSATDGIVEYARNRGVTHIVLSQSGSSSWRGGAFDTGTES